MIFKMFFISAIVSGSTANFGVHLAKYVSAMPFLSLTNNLLKYGLDELKLRFRTKLTQFLYSKYLKWEILIEKNLVVDSTDIIFYLSQEFDLLQNEQLGQSYCQRRPAAHSGRGKVLQLAD